MTKQKTKRIEIRSTGNKGKNKWKRKDGKEIKRNTK
jgi:hypothetical protein